jgi:transcriptional regulator with XRE-family HTH domain
MTAQAGQAQDSADGARPAEAESALPRVGAAIRRFRHERGLSLQQLADGSGVSVGMLSQIERDLANPSLRLLTSVRRALGVPLSALFAEDEPSAEHPGDPSFVRRADHRPRFDLGFVKEVLSPATAQDLQFMLLTVPPGGTSNEQMLSFLGEKAGLMLSGTLDLTVRDQTARLLPGDSFQFWGGSPHSFANPGEEPAILVWIIGRTLIERYL